MEPGSDHSQSGEDSGDSQSPSTSPAPSDSNHSQAGGSGGTDSGRSNNDDSALDANGSESGSGDGQVEGKSPFRFFGPGFLVAAAFVGPGTVATAIQAGGGFGFHLLWAVFFAAIATIIFQNMAARLGLVTKKGLAESITGYFENEIAQKICIGIILAAIVFGNTAYQAGNLSGAAAGLFNFLPAIHTQIWLLICSGLAFYLIWTGTLKTFKVVLVSLVVAMSLAFLVAALNSRPNLPELLAGCFSFEVDKFNLAVVVAIIGTTVVPYNLFLHSSSLAEQHQNLSVDISEQESAEQSGNEQATHMQMDFPPSEFDQAIAGSRLDTMVAVWIGALITAMILITAASASVLNFEEAAESLTGLIGGFGKSLFFVGLFAAGLTSAITAPLAAGYVFAGCFGFHPKANSEIVRRVACVILVIGYLVAVVFGKSPQQIIFLAQVANGLVLPLIAVFLLMVMNSKKLLGRYRNRWPQNLFGGAVVALIIAITGYQLGFLFGILS